MVYPCLKVVPLDESRFLSPPMRLVPESPEQNALDRRVSVQRPQSGLQEIGPLVLILGHHVQLRHPDREAGLSKLVQPLLGMKE